MENQTRSDFFVFRLDWFRYVSIYFCAKYIGIQNAKKIYTRQLFFHLLKRKNNISGENLDDK